MISLYIAISILWSSCLMAGLLVGRFLGGSRVIFAGVVVLICLPWFGQHYGIVTMAMRWQVQEARMPIPGDVIVAGPGLILLSMAAAMLLRRKSWRLIAALPFFAFVISYRYTVPRLIYFTDFHFDGLGINFLFVMTVGASLFGFCYVVSALPVIRKAAG